MPRFHRNIEYLIKSRGLSVKGASKEAGLGETTIRDILANPNKSSRIDTIDKLAAFFHISRDQLMGADLQADASKTHNIDGSPDNYDSDGIKRPNQLGTGELREDAGGFSYPASTPALAHPAATRPENRPETIRELDVNAQGGAGQLVDQENIVREWGIPADYLQVFTRTQAENLYIIGVTGDSMTPDFPPGQRVLVDVSDRIPSPEGVFVIYDGFGLMIKRCQMIPYSNPATVRLISANKEYPVTELELDDDMIKGRVIGAWKWY